MAVYNEDVVRVVISAKIDGQDVVNVLHVSQGPGTGGAIDAAALSALALAARDSWVANVLPQLAADYTLERVICYHLTGPGGLVLEQSAGSASGGVTTGETLPNSVAVCATLLTGLAGRSQRGRLYLSGWSTDAIEGNQITTIQAAALTLALNVVVADLDAAGWTLGVYSTVSAGVPRAVGQFTPVLNVALRDRIVDSRRNRLPGRGS